MSWVVWVLVDQLGGVVFSGHKNVLATLSEAHILLLLHHCLCLILLSADICDHSHHEECTYRVSLPYHVFS